MYKNLLLLVLITVFVISCAKPDKFVISGKIKGRDSGTVKMLKMGEGRWITEDSASISKGEFKLTGKSDLPELRIITIGPREIIAQFFAENGNISIQSYADSIDKSVITGSKSNDEFKTYQQELANLSKETQGMQQKFMTSQQRNDQEGMKNAQIDYEAMVQNFNVYSKNFIRQHKNSTVSPLIALMQFGQTIKASEVDTLLAYFDPSIKSSIYIGELKKIGDRMRATEVGAIAPDFTLNTPDGTPFTLSSTRGKIVLLDFWAAWCQPCRQENPNVVALYEKYKDKGFDIVGISLDRTKEEWMKAIADDHLTWHHVSELKAGQIDVAIKYGVATIPATFLLDKSGKILAKDLRGEALASKLQELFGK